MIDYTIQLNNQEFKETIDSILRTNRIDEIIETGTFHGDGSTKVFAETKRPVFTIECNFNNWQISTSNLKSYKNVTCIHGLSIRRNELIKKLMTEKFDIETTYDSDYPKNFYLNEICQPVVVDGALELLANNHQHQLVFLDSAGGVGYHEFLHFMQFEPSFITRKVLLLDDISHIKHKRSVEYLKSQGFEVTISKDKRFAVCDFQNHNNLRLLI